MRSSSTFLPLALVLGISFTPLLQAQVNDPPAAAARASSEPRSGVVPQSSPPPSAQAPTGGRRFGEHVSGMAPEHPRTHGRLFGECVSEMATTGLCPHHDDE